MPLDLTWEQAINDMKACQQTAGLSVYKHGEMVYERFETLADALDEIVYDNVPDALLKLDPSEWRIPAWLHEHVNLIRTTLDNVGSMIPHIYLLYHDIGKPYCRTVDADGRQHFLNHAAVSEHALRTIAETHDFGNHQQRSYFIKQDMLWVAELIGQDMDAHLLKQEGVEEFASRSNAPILMLAALSEIHANAGMFGGIESTSFKIKWKQLDKMGKRVFEKIVANSAAHKTGI